MKILFHSNFSRLQTGFGRHAREVLKYLHSTGKYEIIEYANAPIRYDEPILDLHPWKIYGALPNDEILSVISKDPAYSKAVGYGAFYIDEIIEKEQPDVYIGTEDFWAFHGYWDKPWWNKIHCVIWTTLDSLPVFEPARKNAGKIKNLWVWADFAEEALKELGHDHVKTVYAAIDNTSFFPLPPEKKEKIREKHNIDGLVFGFVFRNQLRKLVGTLIEGFGIFKQKNPDVAAKLLLHTSWSEGWDIKSFAKEYGVDMQDILTTYVCSTCHDIKIMPYTEERARCASCGERHGLHTTNLVDGCSEEKLNEVYNLMDGYIHPMTSGGFEMPILEAIFAGVPAATVPYSCGTNYTQNPDVFSLDYIEYREFGTQFKKAQPLPQSIACFMEKISSLKESERESLGAKVRDWALEKFSNEKSLKHLENFLDSLSPVKYDFPLKTPPLDTTYPNPDIEDPVEWLQDIYSNILRMEEDKDSDDIKHWLDKLEAGASREEIYKYFIEIAKQSNREKETVDARDWFKTDDDKKKLVYIMPQSLGDCLISLSILDEIAEIYPRDQWHIYVCTKTENMHIFSHLDYVTKIVPFTDVMNNFQWWEGAGPEQGIVDIALHPYFGTQIAINTQHNGIDIDTLQTQ